MPTRVPNTVNQEKRVAGHRKQNAGPRATEAFQQRPH